MTTRTDEEIIKQIKELIESHVKPGVASHGGNIEFVDYKEGNLLLELGGACSGCSGSTITLKLGVENMIKHYVPEVHTVEAQDDPFSTVDPFYSDPFAMQHDWDEVDDTNNK
jgi:Fe-S cluster biogenesis protein NfuA|tara:strand:- start:4652 stop:4987 length:336 start_codon:yes stop_codon:yes gene_type:complete